MNDNKQSFNVDNLRFIPISMIDEMINHIISANKSAFDLYFNLIKAREQNKISAKAPTIKEPAEVINEESAINQVNDDKS